MSVSLYSGRIDVLKGSPVHPLECMMGIQDKLWKESKLGFLRNSKFGITETLALH